MVRLGIRKGVKALLALMILASLLILGTGAIAAENTSLVNISNPTQVVVNASFVSPLVELFGDVAIGSNSFISGNTMVRADPGTRICLGSETNLQDNILFLAMPDTPTPMAPCASKSSSTGDQVSIAHQAIVKNSRIGSFTFVGFHAYLNNVVLEDGAFVLHGARLENVTIGKDKLVPIGAVITTQAVADALPTKTQANADFQSEVLKVNEEFAESYGKLYSSAGYQAVTGVSAAPATAWNAHPVSPQLGENVQLDEFVRIVGNVQIGRNSSVGQRTSIRADEGSPMIIGENAHIEDRVTFHALKGTDIHIGKNLKTSDNVVFHGPLQVGDNLTIDDDAILFRSTVGNQVTIEAGAIVVGVNLRDGTQVPANARIITQDLADQLQVIE